MSRGYVAPFVAILACAMFAITNEANAGIFHRRRACYCPAPSPQAEPTQATVELLATSVVKIALDVSQSNTLDNATRRSILAELNRQIGPVSADPGRLAQLLQDGIVNRQEVRDFIRGEVSELSARLTAQ